MWISLLNENFWFSFSKVKALTTTLYWIFSRLSGLDTRTVAHQLVLPGLLSQDLHKCQQHLFFLPLINAILSFCRSCCVHITFTSGVDCCLSPSTANPDAFVPNQVNPTLYPTSLGESLADWGRGSTDQWIWGAIHFELRTTIVCHTDLASALQMESGSPIPYHAPGVVSSEVWFDFASIGTTLFAWSLRIKPEVLQLKELQEEHHNKKLLLFF